MKHAKRLCLACFLLVIVAMLPASHAVWAVGYAQNPQTNAATTLIEYYC